MMSQTMKVSFMKPKHILAKTHFNPVYNNKEYDCINNGLWVLRYPDSCPIIALSSYMTLGNLFDLLIMLSGIISFHLSRKYNKNTKLEVALWLGFNSLLLIPTHFSEASVSSSMKKGDLIRKFLKPLPYFRTQRIFVLTLSRSQGKIRFLSARSFLYF